MINVDARGKWESILGAMCDTTGNKTVQMGYNAETSTDPTAASIADDPTQRPVMRPEFAFDAFVTPVADADLQELVSREAEGQQF